MDHRAGTEPDASQHIQHARFPCVRHGLSRSVRLVLRIFRGFLINLLYLLTLHTKYSHFLSVTQPLNVNSIETSTYDDPFHLF